SRRLFRTRALVLAAAILALPVLYGFWWWSGEREPDYPRVSPPPVPEQNAFDFYIAAGISVQGLDELENADADDTDLRREFLSRNEEAEQLISQAHEMEYGFPSG